MSRALDAFLARHSLPPEAVAELRALVDATPAGSPTATFDGRTVAFDGLEPERVELVAGFEDLGPLGEGGASVVRRVHEPALARSLAMKVGREATPAAVARFLREARLTAALEHPGIVPIHALGVRDDGRPWFTMREVRGVTLGDRIRGVHRASDPAGRWVADPDGWTLERLVEAFRRVCETVGHAHARGVVHRDLKPDNVVVGESGEVLVVDWGIARRLDEARAGEIAGTPAYMPPEQARGEAAVPASDVFALGATLAEILAGAAPRTGATVEAVLAAAASTPVRPRTPPRPVPPALVALVAECLDPAPDRRPADASVVAERVRRFQDGVERRERAAALVAEAEGLRAAGVARAAEIAHLQGRHQAAASGLRTWDPVDRKAPVWALQDALDALRLAHDLDELRITELLRAALTQDPDAAHVHRALAERHQRAHAEALAAGDSAAARRAEVELRAHDDGRFADWLAGIGEVCLETEPPGAVARVFRMPREDRRVPEWVADHVTPAVFASPAESLVVVLERAGSAPCRVPVLVERCRRWPAAGGAPIRLLPADDLGPDDVYVPAGPFAASGDPRAPAGGPRRSVDLPGFVVQRFPVTNREYLGFLDDLVARGHDPGPRVPSLVGDPRPPFGQGPDGRFALVPDAQGDVWEPDWPVFAVSAEDARAYAAWWAERTGRPWRLGTPDEWEKAARGVDGRAFPWGDRPESTWACVRGAREGRPLPSPVGAVPADESVYGVRDLAGGAATVTQDAQGRTFAQGGSWSYPIDSCRSAMRSLIPPDRRTPQVGIRLFRDA